MIAAGGLGRAALVAENRNQEDERDVDAGDGGGVSRAFEAQARRAPVAVHEEPVAGEVEEVGADHGEGDGLDDVHRLQVAAEGGVEEQGEHAPEQGVDEGAEQFHDARIGADGAQQGDGEGEQQGDDGGDADGDPQALDEGAAASGIVPGAERLRDQGIHAGQHAGAADGDGVEEHAAEAAGADGGGAEAAGHDGIDEAHRHPAEFGHGERRGEAQHGTDLLAEAAEAVDHALGCALS